MKTAKVFTCLMLLFFCSISIYTPSTFGAPYTEAAIRGYAGSNYYPADMPWHTGFYWTDLHYVSCLNSLDGRWIGNCVVGDSSIGEWVAGSAAESTAYYGVNEALARIFYNHHLRDSLNSPGNSIASYDLTWLSTQNNQSGSLINISMSDSGSINATLTGTLQFVYGVPYEIKSVLDTQSTAGGAYAQAVSTWDDTITFYGKPDGSLGIASFIINLDGSLTETHIIDPTRVRLWFTGWSDNTYSVDFDALLSDINIPDGSWILAASGTHYATSVPEPTSLLLLGLGLI